MWSWGYDIFGELGNGTVATTPAWSFSPSQVTGLSGVTAISAGSDNGYALRSDGTAWGWGSDGDGELDNGQLAGSSAVPSAMAGLTGATAIFGGYSVAFALFPNRT